MVQRLIVNGLLCVVVAILAVAELFQDGIAEALRFGPAGGFIAFFGGILLKGSQVRKQWKQDIVTSNTIVTSNPFVSGERGVRIPQSDGLWLAVIIVITCVPVAIIVFALLGAPSYSKLALVVVLLTIFLLLIFRVRVGREIPCRLFLASSGIYYHANTRADEVFVPWESILSVAPGRDQRDRSVIRVTGLPGAVEHVSKSTPLGRELRHLSLHLFSEHESPHAPDTDVVTIHAHLLGVDSALPYFAINYYWHRQDARDELGNETGLLRIRSGDLMIWFPAERARIIESVRALADNEQHNPMAVPHELQYEIQAREHSRTPSRRIERVPVLSHGDHLVIHMNYLFDETNLFPDVQNYTWGVLYEDEVPILEQLGNTLDPVVQDFGGGPGQVYQADPRWNDVVRQAERAAYVMEAHG